MSVANVYRRAKSIVVDWRKLEGYDDQRLCCVRLTSRQIQALVSQAEYLRWRTRYTNLSPDIDEMYLDSWVTDMVNKLVGGCTEDWRIQYPNALLFADRRLAYYGGVYDGTPSSAFPLLDDGDFDPENGEDLPPYYDAVVCAALRDYVYQFRSSAAHEVANDHDWLVTILLAAGLLAVAAVAPYVLVIAAVLAIAASPEEVADVLADDVAADDVICAWRAELVGVRFDRTEWIAAFYRVSFGGDTPAEQLHEMLAHTIDSLDAWLWFLHNYNQRYQQWLSGSGVLPCPCDGNLVRVTFEPLSYANYEPLADANHDVTVVTSASPSRSGDYVARGGDRDFGATGSYGHAAVIEVDLLSSRTVVGVSYWFNWFKIEPSGIAIQRYLWLYDSSYNELYTNFQTINASMNNWHEQVWDGLSVFGVRYVRVMARYGTGVDNVNNRMHIDDISVWSL